jgi:tellurite resistance protein TerC
MSLPRKGFVKRIAVAVVGGTITLLGFAMIVLPGPAIVVIPVGLSILATEFVWARRYRRRCRTLAMEWKEKIEARARARREPDVAASESEPGARR